MKKSLFISLILVGLVGFGIPLLVGAADPIETVNIKADEIPGIIMNLATWLYRIVLAVAVIFALIAAFQYLSGNPKTVEKAHKQLLYSVIGIIVAIFAFSIVAVVQSVIKK